ncbi:MAG: ABC transporter permease [Clostridiaceae bacterium]|nr:ABC transporter permease [Clostridiaceae bacterium]
MRNVIILVKNNLKICILNKPIIWILTTIIPIIFLFFATKIFNTNIYTINVGIIDNDKTISSERVINVLNKSKGVECRNINECDIKEEFNNKNMNVVLKIDKGFQEEVIKGNQGHIQFLGSEDDKSYSLIEGALSNEIGILKSAGNVSQGDEVSYFNILSKSQDNCVSVDLEEVSDNSIDNQFMRLFIGLVVMFMFSKATEVALNIDRDKENNVYTRVFITTVKTWQYYGANMISSLITIIFQIIIALIGMEVVLNVSSDISIFSLFIILVLIAIIAVTLSTLYVAVSKNSDDISLIANIVNIVLETIGGCFMPTKYLSGIINKISYYTPTRWAMSAIEKIQLGQTFDTVIVDVLIMILFATAFFTISIYAIRRKDKSFITIL